MANQFDVRNLHGPEDHQGVMDEIEAAMGAPAVSTDEDSTLDEGVDFVLGTTTGTKIGTSVSQKLAFHDSTPVIQRVGAAQASVTATSTNGVAAAAIPGALTSTNGVAAAAIPGALTSTNGTAAAASADLSALAAEAEKIGDDVRAVHAAVLLAQAENEKIGDDSRAIHAAALLAQAENEKIGDDVRATITLVNEIRAALVEKGLIKGAA